MTPLAQKRAMRAQHRREAKKLRRGRYVIRYEPPMEMNYYAVSDNVSYGVPAPNVSITHSGHVTKEAAERVKKAIEQEIIGETGRI